MWSFLLVGKHSRPSAGADYLVIPRFLAYQGSADSTLWSNGVKATNIVFALSGYLISDEQGDWLARIQGKDMRQGSNLEFIWHLSRWTSSSDAKRYGVCIVLHGSSSTANPQY